MTSLHKPVSREAAGARPYTPVRVPPSTLPCVASEQLFAGGRVETPAGTLDIPTFPASSAGVDLREMVLGSEGRLGIVTQPDYRADPVAAGTA